MDGHNEKPTSCVMIFRACNFFRVFSGVVIVSGLMLRACWSEEQPPRFVEKFLHYLGHVEGWTASEVAEVEAARAEYRDLLRRSAETVPMQLRSEVFFTAVSKAFTQTAPIDENVLRNGRGLIGDWLGTFLKWGHPSPEERARVVEVISLLLSTTTKEVSVLRSGGVVTSDGGFWNGFGSGRTKIPMPPRMAKANHLRGLIAIQKQSIELIWTQFRREPQYKSVAERKTFLLAKGITESELADLLLLLPEADRTR